MPRPPLPTELVTLLERANPAVIATVRPDGTPHTVATWYAWEDGRVLVNMDESRRRLAHIRHDPRVALTVFDGPQWYRHVSLLGEVVSVALDQELSDIDRLSTHYTGRPFRSRDARRWSAWIEIHRWHAWDGAGPWRPPTDAS
jgi:PPOX class probable F420-dependent enzyme